MISEITPQYSFFDICFTIEDYSLSKDYDDIYLGYDNYLEVDATCKLKAVFRDNVGMQNFYDQWETETERGKLPFIIKLDYFGNLANYGIIQESPLVMKRKNGYNVTFDARIIFDESEIDNQLPECRAKTVYVPENTRDNYIRVDGDDPENNPFTYELQVPTAYGQLRGAPPAFLYTPDPGFEGTDCFSYNTKDFFGKSLPCVVEIVVDTEKMPIHRVRYTTTDLIGASGNFFYSWDDVSYKRGFGGLITPYTSEFELTRNGTFNADPDSGETGWEAVGDAVIKDGSIYFFEGDFTTTVSADVSQDVVLNDGDTYRVEVVIEQIEVHTAGGGVHVDLNGAATCATSVLIEDGTHIEEILYDDVTGGPIVSIVCDDASAIISRVRVWRAIDTSEVWVRSDDHKLDPAYPNVTQCLIREWGERTDFRSYLIGQDNLDPDIGFSICEMAGHCEGEDFTSMFEDTSVVVFPILMFDKMIISDRMFYNSRVERLKFHEDAYLIQHYWKSARQMFAHSDITNVFEIQTYWVQDFTEMFYDTPLVCLEFINTAIRSDRPVVGKSRLFDDTPALQKPSVSDVANIMDADGMSYNNNGGCGIIVTSITRTGGMASCEVANYGGSCMSMSTYTVNYVNETAPVSFNWNHSTGTVMSGGGSGDNFIEISISSDVEISFTVSCNVTDAQPSHASSGAYNFTHSRTYGFDYFTLPKYYSQINLKDFINSKSPATNNIVVRNSKTNCSLLASGFPGAWDVTLINDGEFQGFHKGNTSTNYSTNHGVYVSVDNLRLINNGVIRGAGGYGGTGGKGHNKTNSSTQNHAEKRASSVSSGSYWMQGHSCSDTVCWDSKCITTSYAGASVNISGLSGTVYKRDHQVTYGNQGACVTKYYYYLERKWTTSSSYTMIGGNGGGGGYGCGYNKSTDYNGSWRDGSGGSGSSPSGGYSGATGGHGGWWGNTGQTGYTHDHAYGGAAGRSGCPAIEGSSRLLSGSKIGTLSGAKS